MAPFPPTFVAGFHDEEAVKKMVYRPLGNTGMMVSVLSFGASSFAQFYHPVDTTEAQSIALVRDTIRRGVNYIDTAVWYGQGFSEELLGKALATVPRQAYYIATKACRYEKDVDRMFDFSRSRTIASVRESLARLRLDYVDVIQAHDVEFADSVDIVLNETIPALDEIRNTGLARFIGITGYPLSVLREIIERSPIRIDMVLSYCRYTLLDQSLSTERFIDFCRSKKVGLVNASPISMGLLSSRPAPVWHPASESVRSLSSHAYEFCAKNGVSLSRLAVWYTLFSREDLATTLVSTACSLNMHENLNVVHNPELTEVERETLLHILNMFGKHQPTAWEGVELARYRAKLNRMQRAL